MDGMSGFLALIWLVCGLGVLTYQAASGDTRLSLHILGTSVSSGWVMLVMAGYNFLRWWSRRPMSRTPRYTVRDRDRRHRRRHDDETRERNPDFIFTDDPPPDAPPHE
jgi:hypothetical protein